MQTHFDFIILGGGSAGYAAARTASDLGAKVAVVDGSHILGGLCILRGCMPSKALIYAAEILYLAREGEKFGLKVSEAQADIQALQERKKEIIEEFQRYREEQLQSPKYHLFRNHGRFIDEGTIELNDEANTRLTANKFLIATGSIVSKHNFANLDKISYLTSDDVLELEVAPKSMIVLGGGFIACELAQFLNRIGVQVTIIQRGPYLVSNLPNDASKVLEEAFHEGGITVYTNTDLQNVEQDHNGVSVTFQQNGKKLTCHAEKIFSALGRSPNTENLGLDKVGVKLSEKRRILTNDYQQTTNPAIYAAGDCTSKIEIVHVAILQGECAAKHALTGHASTINYDTLVKIVFTDPQIAIAGIPEEDLVKRGIKFISASYPFDDHGKAILMKAKWGYVKLLAEASTGKILGAECVGKDASELIHSIAVGITLNGTVFDLLKTHWYHPTLSEIWAYPLEEIAEKIKK